MTATDMSRIHAVRIAEHGATQPDKVALRRREGDVWQSTTYRELGELVAAAAAALHRAGVGAGDRVMIFGQNSVEWITCLLGAQWVGAIPFGAYATSSVPDIEHLLRDAEPRAVLLGGAHELGVYERAVAAGAPPSAIVAVVDAAPGAVRWGELVEGAGRPPSPVPHQADACAVIVYTSGSTGKPKGAMLSHGNLDATLASLQEALEFTADDTLISYLPLNHIAEQAATVYMGLVGGATIWMADATATVLDDLVDVRPSIFLTVPRFLENLLDRIDRAGATDPAAALAAVGLDRVRYVTSSGAPAAESVISRWNALGIEVREGWGLTETSGCVTFTRRGAHAVGTVGVPLGQSAVVIDEHSEILVSGGGVFIGYWRQPAATASCIRAGWLHTGDLGQWDGDGVPTGTGDGRNLRIVGRLKDLIITAGAKNIAPAEIEASLAGSPLVRTAVVVGDRRPYLVALLELDDEAARQRFGDVPDEELRRLSREHVAADVARTNEGLARVAQIKRFEFLPRAIDTDHGEMTATGKVKRHTVIANNRELIDAVYGEAERR